ncbi:hypothetical protein C8F04DRAFT_1098684 [Mycena alexandri]|uniref:Uncharacterized protein n=1 Tax=Mycena alexandri TaxID=1745969 RepID=A0AAD6SX12_9AGAR|nr:hypothetical protein C8F04DRAFT_1098684 [Mycena alexandri]
MANLNGNYVAATSLLEVFADTAENPATAGRSVLECGQHTWTYASLDAISTGLADELRLPGCAPRIAVVGENHPFVFALMLAVWKLGGIFIPIDAHVPVALLAGMIKLVKPTYLFLSGSDSSNISRASEWNDLRIITFGVEDCTIPALNEKYASSMGRRIAWPLPNPDQPCLYLFTSSASSPNNLKPVPFTHISILSGCRSKLEWWRRTQPSRNMDGIRVLGWAPWSHVLSYMQDIGTGTFLNAGCYVFVSVPNSYQSKVVSAGLTSMVADAIINKNVTAFACLPFVISGLKELCEGTFAEKTTLLRALRNMVMFECGGATLGHEVSDWIANNEIPLMVGVGMTETAGAIFAGRAQDTLAGFSAQGLIADAQFSLIGSEGKDEGELVIKSKLLPHGYINYDDGSFSVDEEGWVEFKTGDRYRRTDDGKYVWLGRTIDFIQMASGEYFDPRPIEKFLRSSNFIRNACLIGDKFLGGASSAVCAIVELADTETTPDMTAAKFQIARVLAPINRDLPPALRIALSSVLILDSSQKIPQTKKGEVFRKQIEDLFGSAIRGMQNLATHSVRDAALEQVETSVARIVGNVLGVFDDDMLASMSFAELGMTSLLATKIANALNDYLNGQTVLPSNICYVHLDIPSLASALRELLDVSTKSRKYEQTSTQVPLTTAQEIVMIGRAFRLPGNVTNDDALWDALMGNNDSIIAAIPPNRWDHESFFPDDICFNKAGLVDAASYDFGFFGVTATEAYYISPTMRLALEVAFEALENANVPISKVKGSKMGVFVATKDDGFETLLNAAHGYDGYTRFYGTGRAPSTASGRISYLLDIHGPSLTIDTACSGGLVCVDQAVNYLQTGAAEMALICSSNTHCWPGSFMFLTAQGMVSPNSRCAAFTSEADGYVPSEGAVAFILKTRSAAERDNDRIFATIKATEVSHNGRSQGLAAPNVMSQAALHRSILQKARLDPAHVNFIETHGTGTSLGDLCEIQGINEAFTPGQPRPTGPLIISASKSALGHTEPSAGLVGILSTLLSFEKSMVPGLVHLREDNPNHLLDCSAVPLLIPSKSSAIQGDKPHRAVVMSYGFSGTLADIILESAEKPMQSSRTGPMIFAVSAKTAGALTAYIDRYLAFLRSVDPRMFHAICYTSCIGREHYKHRFACVATDMADLVRQVELRASAPRQQKKSRGSLVFAFPGQGTQFPGMAAELGAIYSRFREFIGEFGRQAEAICRSPIDQILLGNTMETQEHIRSDVDQICIFVYQYSMCRWLNELGIEAGSVLGHSLGEITAAVVAGALSFEAGLDLVVTRAQLLRPSAHNPTGMAALACSEARVSPVLEALGNHEVYVSVFNGPQSICVSGASNGIERLVTAAKQQNIKATRLRVDQGFHSRCVDSAIPGLRSWSESNWKTFRPLQMTLYSTLLGAPIPKGQMLDLEHWVSHARKPVQFSQAAAALREDRSIAAVIDIGPQMVISSLLLLNGQSGGSIVSAAAKKGENQEITFLRALATLFQDHRIAPDFRRLFSQRRGSSPFQTTDIPTYPFQRVRCYPSYIPSRFREGSNNARIPQELDSEKPDLNQESVVNIDARELRESLMSCVRDVLEFSPDEDLDDSEPLIFYGVDSIMFANLRKKIDMSYGLNLSILFWSDAFPITSMIENLVEQYAEK